MLDAFTAEVAVLQQGGRDIDVHSREPLQRAIAADSGLAAINPIDLQVAPHTSARVYPTSGPSIGSLVWVHGGSFIGGSLDDAETVWPATLLAAAGFDVLTLSYRKALNGVQYPLPVNDVLEGWRWATANLPAWSSSPSVPALGGASAGGFLVTAALFEAQAEGITPSSLVLAYPTLHAFSPVTTPQLERALARTPLERRFPAELVLAMHANFQGVAPEMLDGREILTERSVDSFPPTFVLNSEFDDLRGSGEAFAANLVVSGVPVRCEFEPGTFHGHLNEPTGRKPRRSIDRIVTWLSDRSRLD